MVGRCKKFKPILVLNLRPGERISEHIQVRNALYNFGEKIMVDELFKLGEMTMREYLILVLWIMFSLLKKSMKQLKKNWMKSF